ncbi:MAG: HAMP domain-containing histidine kinase [Tannerella sp.]|jgi:signal transduction histidine kinase|nr:HAMP domain-containing histidine kinase [Tannerella sp.]
MKKSTIWLLAIVMGFAFAGLIYLQVNYVKAILKTSNDQFNATVRRCLEDVSHSLELDEVAKYLQNDYDSWQYRESYSKQTEQSSITLNQEYSYGITRSRTQSNQRSQTKDAIIRQSEEQQRDFYRRYQHESGLVSEVLYDIVYTAWLKPIQDRIDFDMLNEYLKAELKGNNLDLPYIIMIVNKDGQTVYQNTQFDKPLKAADIITGVLFSGDPPSKRNYLKIYFPTKRNYISSSVSFLVPSIIFSVILLMTFTITIYTIFRQKKLSEMKNDFVNNMTHELKTPVSTISLAAQMLKDTDISKNPDVFKHISNVINDETKRLNFLVEKVLQISLFEKQRTTLKLKEIDANDLISSVASTFALKVEKYGGTIDIDLKAEQSTILADPMHLTNVLFNLLDNAVKYRRQEVPLWLMARTKNEGGKLVVMIEDNGIGIKKEHLKKIFDRFFRVQSGNVHDVKGFGLGLAYVRKIVEDHGGSIRAEQEEGFIGTKFIIVLPLIKN